MTSAQAAPELPSGLVQSEYRPPVQGAPEAIIAVMGVTGSGKSTFIRTVSGDDTVVVGDGLKSCTSDLRAYNFHYKGYNVKLVDSPGFNDTFRSETSVLQDIAAWLQASYESDKRETLNGLIYLHSISHSRMEGSAMRNLRMFRELCGSEPLKNVVLATTFWGQVDAKIGQSRVEELIATPEFWGNMLKRGSRLAQFTSLDSGLDIVGGLLGTEPEPLQIQRELVEEHVSLIETGAGQIVNQELTRLEQKHRKEKEQMQQEMMEALQARDTELQELLSAEQERVEQELSRVQRQQAQLKADQRSDRRRLLNDFEAQLWELESRNSMLQEEKEERDRRIQEYDEEARQKWNNLDLDEVIAKVRAEESKLRVNERIALEAEIEKFKAATVREMPKTAEAAAVEERAKTESTHRRRAKRVGAMCIMALRTALPMATLIMLGLPIHLPGGDSLLEHLRS